MLYFGCSSCQKPKWWSESKSNKAGWLLSVVVNGIHKYTPDETDRAQPHFHVKLVKIRVAVL